MNLTKYQHACFTVEKNDQILVVDPGNLSNDFVAPDKVVAVVITHRHPDHYDYERLMHIFEKNPDCTVYAPTDVIDQLEALPAHAVETGQTISAGDFELEFFGGVHALIHDDIPRVQNLGVMIDELVYYPGDSFTLPGTPVDTLALPVAAPWMKISEAITFLQQAQPRFAFPTHDAILSTSGREIVDRLVQDAATTVDAKYQRLTQPIDV